LMLPRSQSLPSRCRTQRLESKSKIANTCKFGPHC
jgi:hypothetical protein